MHSQEGEEYRRIVLRREICCRVAGRVAGFILMWLERDLGLVGRGASSFNQKR